MTPTTRLIINTLAQNLRTIINICLSLYSTRLVMNILGQSDYGIYFLVAGIVSFLSYFTTAMVTSTQRHLSFSHGQKNASQTRQIFANSYIINCFMGALLLVIMLSLISWLFNGTTLNIAQDRYDEARWVYLIVLASVFLTFVTAPFKAVFIARENIVYISFVDVLDGILKVALVFGLYLCKSHRLVIYSCIISMVMLFNFLAFAIYAKLNYEECCLIPSFKLWNKRIQKRLINFTTWTAYASISIYLRNQGIAVLLNKAYGTIINTSFGIAGQILGSLAFLSSAILNAFTPQIIKSEGEGNRAHMLTLCLKACKYCYLLLALCSFPILFEMQSILAFWLGEVPPNAVLFCRIFLVSSLFDQLTTGLNVANQALGKIQNYTLIIYTTKLLAIPLTWLAISYDCKISIIMMAYLLIEILTAILRLPYISLTTGLYIRSFIKEVIQPIVVPTIIAIVVSYFLTLTTDYPLRFIMTASFSIITTIAAIWFFSFDKNEKNYIRVHVLSKIHKQVKQ